MDHCGIFLVQIRIVAKTRTQRVNYPALALILEFGAVVSVPDWQAAWRP